MPKGGYDVWVTDLLLTKMRGNRYVPTRQPSGMWSSPYLLEDAAGDLFVELMDKELADILLHTHAEIDLAALIQRLVGPRTTADEVLKSLFIGVCFAYAGASRELMETHLERADRYSNLSSGGVNS